MNQLTTSSTATSSQLGVQQSEPVGFAKLNIRSLILPLYELNLLVPNAVVAEVSDYAKPNPAPHAPAWLLGMLSWRGRSVPLVSFEQLIGREAGKRGPKSRIVVLNTVNGRRELPFIALAVQGIPRLVQVTERKLEQDDEQASEAKAVAAHVRMQGEHLIIPDMDVLEKMLLHLGVHVTG